MDKKKQKISSKQKKKGKENRLELLMSKKWFFPLFFLVVTLIVYFNSFNVPFQFDDHNQISYREWCHSFDYYKDLSNWLKVNDRIFAFFTITINYVLHAEKVFGYHLVNFLIHFSSGLVLFYLLKILPVVSSDENKRKWFPVVVTLFFLVHPVQTQSVTYIIQRMASLAGLFVLLSVYFYVIGRKKQLESGKVELGVSSYLLAFFAGILGVLSKQNAIIFPLLFLLVEYFFVRNSEGKICKKYLVSVSAAGAIAFLVFVFFIGLPAETTSVSRMQYFATQMVVIPRYFQMMLVPVGLSIDHGVKIVDNVFNIGTIAGSIFLVALLISAFLTVKKEPLFSFGIFWIFITLSVESSILPITDPMFDQRMYLPVAGFGISLWAVADRFLFRKKANLFNPTVIFVLVLFSIITISRNHVWNSRIAIWEDVTQKYPDHLRGWMALGKMYLNDENPDIIKAIECFEHAKTIDPDNEENLIDLGFAYMSNRQEEKGLACYEQLLKSKNRDYREQALRVMSVYESSKGEADDAEKNMRKLLKIKPDDFGVWESLFNLYFAKKDYRKSNEIANEWLSKYPNNSDAMYYLGKSFFQLKEKEEAEKYFQAALRINPKHAEAMMLYANVCVNKFEYDKAIDLLEKAYAINQNNTIPGNIELIKQLKIKVPKPASVK